MQSQSPAISGSKISLQTYVSLEKLQCCCFQRPANMRTITYSAVAGLILVLLCQMQNVMTSFKDCMIRCSEERCDVRGIQCYYACSKYICKDEEVCKQIFSLLLWLCTMSPRYRESLISTPLIWQLSLRTHYKSMTPCYHPLDEKYVSELFCI